MAETRLSAIAAFTIVLAALAGGEIAAAQETPRDQLERIEHDLQEGRARATTLEEEATQLQRDVRALQRESVESAARAQDGEDRVAAIAGRLAAYVAEERARFAALEERRKTIQTMLGALQRISRLPSEVLMAGPGTVLDNVRTSILLSAVIPELEAQAERLRSELEALRLLRGEISDERDRLSGAQQIVLRERLALNRLIRRKADLRQRTLVESDEETKRIARLSEDATDLRALMARLEADQARANAADPDLQIPAGTPLFSAAFGALPMPARGRITRGFRSRNAFGVLSQGLTIETAYEAQVIAPHDGRTVFAGPFRGYGQLLIIAHGEGYHSLLAGITRIEATVGQLLLAGEPVGQMGPVGGGKPELYVELRHKGESIDPLPWLATTETKVGG
jgi:septal ring factor EnvC (AmiA/AmiB activator)